MTDAGAPVEPEISGTLADVLPSVLASLVSAHPGLRGADPGSVGYAARPRMSLTPARRAVVVLVDGLGDELLRRRAGHAPTLRAALPAAYRMVCGFPSTTATSMGSFGTGLSPGAHGLVGYEVLDPERDVVVNELSWLAGELPGPDPRRWQPHPTVFEQAEQCGVAVTRIGPGFFHGSGLTEAALRGGRFRGASALSARVELAVEAVRESPAGLVYLYWGDLDKVGHLHGAGSGEWTEQLEGIDAEIGRLVQRVPADTAVYLTADHGMVDVPFDDRIDLADEPSLLAGVRHVGGEPRSVQLYCQPGAAAEVVAAWTERLGSAAQVWHRDAATAAGLFGPPAEVAERVRPRIGDVVVTMTDRLAVVDSTRMRPELLALLGLHGSTSLDETAIPLLQWPARSADG